MSEKLGRFMHISMRTADFRKMRASLWIIADYLYTQYKETKDYERVLALGLLDYEVELRDEELFDKLFIDSMTFTFTNGILHAFVMLGSRLIEKSYWRYLQDMYEVIIGTDIMQFGEYMDFAVYLDDTMTRNLEYDIDLKGKELESLHYDMWTALYRTEYFKNSDSVIGKNTKIIGLGEYDSIIMYYRHFNMYVHYDISAFQRKLVLEYGYKEEFSANFDKSLSLSNNTQFYRINCGMEPSYTVSYLRGLLDELGDRKTDMIVYAYGRPEYDEAVKKALKEHGIIFEYTRDSHDWSMNMPDAVAKRLCVK